MSAAVVGWSSVLVTASATVIALADAKLHARMNADVVLEDGLVASWTRAAQQQVELDTGFRLLTQTVDLAGDAFPAGRQPIALPFGPLQSVSYIKSYDSSTPSVLQTMAAADYLADVVSIPGRVGLADQAVWPTNLRRFQPVSIRVIAGYASIAAIPEVLLQAVRLAMGWHAANREPTAMEQGSYDWLLDQIRTIAVG